ncbi:DUF1156 domain-containing protein [Truepera radiovictrix]|nr:DUF1156 domain-containing protein [Truepera radiovictrix]WMT57125.1 DUF1156 domain-containing protein [Truepera radiovictrix]
MPKRKLIEVALPLEAINKESAREKSIRHGHPNTLHLWWARRPLAACRAVLFASLVDDPSSHPDKFPTEEAQDEERQRLFRLIEELVKWENTTNEKVLNAARAEILKSTGGNPPPVLDPFAGGGSIPLEAQRLGLEAHASDLNPVAVLINKALIEIPPKFAGRAPINPEAQRHTIKRQDWRGAQGLAEDVRYYGKWMRDEAEKRIGHLYPKAKLPDGGEATVIAWLWARTVTCPNPACGAQMPLVRSFVLSSKKGKEAYAEPVIDREQQPPRIRFEVKSGAGAPKEGTVGRKGAYCVACGSPVSLDHIRSEGRAGRMGAQLMAVVAEGDRGRNYLAPTQEHVYTAAEAKPEWKPEADLPHNPRDFKTPNYGMRTFADLFTPRQLVALTTFSDLVQEARDKVLQDALEAHMPEGEGLEGGGSGARAYADAVAVYLACAVDRMSEYCSTVCTWANNPQMEIVRGTFARQALPMMWDYAEANMFASSTGSVDILLGWIEKVLNRLNSQAKGMAQQDNAATLHRDETPIISTDPPYYDNIGYADLSDYFYIWLRRSLANTYPSIFGTLLVPKSQELVATPYRFDGNKTKQPPTKVGGFERATESRDTGHRPVSPLS